MKTSQEMAARQGQHVRVAREMSDATVHAEIGVCERMGQMSPWRCRLYDALLAERYTRPPITD